MYTWLYCQIGNHKGASVMITKKKWILVLTFCSLLLTAIGCGKSQGTQLPSSADNHAKNLKVTFIELGSVNCIPCKMMQPVMKQIEAQYGNQVAVIFHDVWTEAGKPYAAEFQIQAIPTQVFLDAAGKEYYRHTGFFPFDEVEKILMQKGVK